MFKERNNSNPGTLYLIPTPIGNLGDMTLRAIETMRSVDLLLTEDTRNTQKLLNHFDIKTPSRSYHKFSERKDIEPILNMLLDGKSIALISDAGMPGISDPGMMLVTCCHDEGIPVRVLPGPSAGITALVSSGFKIEGHLFVGFLPRKAKELDEKIRELAGFGGAIIIYEAPHRVRELVSKLAEVMPDRKIHIAREMSKLFEEHIRGKISEVSEKISKIEPRGEYAIILGQLPAPQKRQELDKIKLRDFRRKCIEFGLSVKDSAALYSIATGEKRSEIYKIMSRE